jgi:hypothetical protein
MGKLIKYGVARHLSPRATRASPATPAICVNTTVFARVFALTLETSHVELRTPKEVGHVARFAERLTGWSDLPENSR